jgi:hypothetical protein
MWRLAALILGTLVLIAALALSASSFESTNDPCARYEQNISGEAFKNCTEAASAQRVAIFTEKLANFTFWLMLFTFGLAVVGAWQGRSIYQTLVLNRDQFSAAFPPDIAILRVETINVESVPDEEGFLDTAQPINVQVRLKFVNKGKADAVVKAISARLATSAPDTPDFRTEDFRDAVLPAGHEGSHPFAIRVPNRHGNFDDLTFHLAGYLSYRDPAKKWHKTGFYWRTDKDAMEWIELADSPLNFRY